jgi:hypothetical protein
VRSRGVIPEEDAGLHCFRHGLATELAERSVPVTSTAATDAPC